MNYPIWHLFELGGGTLIAIVAVTHVYVSHLAVGGGILLWWLDRRAARENNEHINDFLRRFNWVFLLVTMVFGGVSGVGIWWTIALVHPAATSTLIHNFVFGWAIEWVFFLGEVTALLVYHYYFDRLRRKDRTTVAFFYGLFAWLSLVVIDGILSFMLTPGAWIESGNFWHGFLNPGYIPSMLFRTFACLMMAGLFTFLVGSYLKNKDQRTLISHIGVRWLLVAFIGMIPTGYWYYYSTPADVRFINFGLNPQMGPMFDSLFVLSPLILLIGLLFLPRTSAVLQRLLAFTLVIIGLLWMGSFEYSREIARKPFIIQEYMYSTGIKVEDIDHLNTAGVLPNAKWSAIHEATSSNAIEAGEELLTLQCMSCHTFGGRNDILSRTEEFTYLGTRAQLTGQGKVLGYMPPMVGTPAEHDALARYIVGELHDNAIETTPTSAQIQPLAEDEVVVPEKSKDYVLLAWNDLGMHCITDDDRWFSLLPPANTIEAQLIKRGDPPEVITEDIVLTYQFQKDHRDPAKHLDFWDWAENNYGAKLERNVGVAGNGVDGEFKLVENLSSFVAEKTPVSPYRDSDGSYMPYPRATVTALSADRKDTLAVTQVVLPASTEMGCRNCHGGDWRYPGGPGVSEETSQNILAAHDRRNGTTLLQEAKAGTPKLCQSCHADPALGTTGDPNVLNFSAAMHGWHANYMPLEGSKACQLCHPAYPQGHTRCQRGVHSKVNMGCTDCHGELTDHALSLLRHEEAKPAAAHLISALTPKSVASVDDVNPRIPWAQEADCITCHQDFDKPADGARAFNKWNKEFAELFRQRHDESGMIRCIACHGATHAIYPATNPYSPILDNIQPMQYQGEPYAIGANQNCQVCHTAKMDEPIHHENMERSARILLTAE